MKIMSVDLGKARTGIAVCDASEILASPLSVLPSYNEEKLLEDIKRLADENRTELIVVGLPLNMDGSSGESAQRAKAFAEKLEEIAGLPVEMQDERGTTITAHGFLNDTNTRGKKRKQTVDAVAATIILQDYLTRRHNNKS